MASDIFDLFLQIGKNKNTYVANTIPVLKESNLKDIRFKKHLSHIHNSYIQIYSSESYSKIYHETNDYVVMKIGKCYPTLAFKSVSPYKRELSTEDLATLYHDRKASIADVIKGIFVLVVYDKQTDTIFALSSKSGLLKLYYYHCAETLLLSTTLDTITRHYLSNTEINSVALIEQLKFGYPLGDLSLIKGISILDNHSWLLYNNKESKLSITQYYSFTDKLSVTSRFSWEQTYAQTSEIFNQILDVYLSGDEPVNVALTSGFDSRAVLSASLKNKKRIQYFSYGASDRSDDVRIPRKISNKLALDYRWVEFKSDFFEQYDSFADQLLYFTDGNGNLKRCNQMYSQSVLSGKSGLCITGCMGSELLRPNNMMCTNILPNMAKLVYIAKPDSGKIAEVLADCPVLMQKDMYFRYKQETFDHIQNILNATMPYSEAYLNLYHYTIRYSLWKFFGQEFQASRIYSNLLSPFIDDDFVEFILKTPVPSLNKCAFKRNAADLRKGQLFYTPILKKNCPELMNMETGRGYTPGQLESALFPFNIIIPFTLRRFKNSFINNKAAFNSSEWNKISYLAHPEVFSGSNDYFRKLDIATVKDNEYSLKKWAMDYM